MKLVALSILIIFSLTAFAEEKITLFVSLTPAGSISAVSKKAKGNLIKENGAFSSDKISVSIESFKTGIDLRDEHFWKHMQSSKNPKATLTNLIAKDGKGTATLEVNGIKKPITLTYAEKGQEVEPKFKVKASDFGMKKAEYLGVGVDDSVAVEATVAYKAR